MTLQAKKYLHDIKRAVAAQRVHEGPFADYESDPMLSAAVEREFEIIGEAMTRLAGENEELVSRITHYRRIIAFRNVSGYADVDNRLVWGVVEAISQL